MKYFLFFFSFLNLMTYGQKEHNKWYFGGKVAFDFSTGSPLSVNNSSMTSFEGCVSIADSSGNLLFYSHGSIVWNKNHDIMANGNGLMGSSSTTQSSFVVKKPGGSSNLYYLFTLGQLGTGSLGYSIIDMSLAAGLGSVTTKNDTLANNMTEKLHGTMHCNGSDVWVVGHKYNSNEFYAYLVTAAGVNTVPIISTIGSIHAAINGTLNCSLGNMKFSPNGKKIGLVIGNSKIIELLDFDPATGQVSNSNIISTAFDSYGCEFSPDNSKFYATTYFTANTNTQRQLHQWDLCAGSNSAIISSHQIITGITSSLTAHYGAAQLAPDGKIYIAFYGTKFISVINDPNTTGSACNFVEQGAVITSTAAGSQNGLPNHISSAHRPKAQLNTNVTSSCGAVTFSFTPPPVICAQASESVTSIKWQFNDPQSASSNTSSANSPQHLYSQNGTYTVTLLVHYSCYTDTLRQVVSVSDFPNLIVSGKQSICIGETSTISLGGAASYSLNGVSGQNTFSVQPISNTSYTVSGTGNGAAACIAYKTISLTVLPCTYLSTTLEKTNSIRIYPNPTSGSVSLETDLNTEIILTDVNGRVVFIRTINSGKHSIDLTENADGIYFLKAKNKNGVTIFKLVKK